MSSAGRVFRSDAEPSRPPYPGAAPPANITPDIWSDQGKALAAVGDGLSDSTSPGEPGTRPTPPPLPRPRKPASQPQAGEEAQGPRMRQRRVVLLHAFWKGLPAWLVSMIVHVVILILLGLQMVGGPSEDSSITLATTVSLRNVEGGLLDPQAAADATEFERPGAVKTSDIVALKSAADRIELDTAAQVIADPLGSLPELNDLVHGLPSGGPGSMVAGRDPHVRALMVQQEGGTTMTEAAVARGLAWLARHQNEEGSWSLDAFHRGPGPRGPGEGLGEPSDTAGTALALLPFLGAGETHQSGQYRVVVRKGLQWLVHEQKPDGDLRGSGIGQMYAHGLAAIVLCEAYAMTRDQQLHEPSQRTLDFIVKAQHKVGGWRYHPREPGDTSVVGWQLMALKSGSMGYLIVPDRTFAAAGHFLDTVEVDKLGSQYSYRPHGATSSAMTAEALLCRQYLGWPKDHRALVAGARYLLETFPPEIDKPNIYYWYYATQVMHHLGGEMWGRWNSMMRSILVETQRVQGPHAGSWDPRGPFSSEGGRIFMTSLALCTLEVYYRHLPLYRRDVLQGIEHGSPAERPAIPE